MILKKVLPSFSPESMVINMDSNVTLDEIRGRALAAIEMRTEPYTPTRYPYTYSADFLRQHGNLIPEDIRELQGGISSRAQAAGALTVWSARLDADRREMAMIFADCYMVENGIPLDAAVKERTAREDA